MSRSITCDDLRDLMEESAGRYIVAMIANGSGTTQFLTFGKTAEDKVEARKWSQWMVDRVFEGDKPEETVTESYILDAAKIKEQRDALLRVCEDFVCSWEDTWVDPDDESHQWREVYVAAKAAIALAKAGGN